MNIGRNHLQKCSSNCVVFYEDVNKKSANRDRELRIASERYQYDEDNSLIEYYLV